MEDQRKNEDAIKSGYITGFDIEQILREKGYAKAFAKAVAAACRAAGLFDRCKADDDLNEIRDGIDEITKLIKEI